MRLFNDGANAVSKSVVRGPESLGVSRETSRHIGAGFTLFLIVLVGLFLWRGHKRLKAFLHPPKRKKRGGGRK